MNKAPTENTHRLIAEASDIAVGMARGRLVIMLLMLAVQVAILYVVATRLPG